MARSFHEHSELEVRTVKAKRVLELLTLVLSIGLVFSACDSFLGSDDDSSGSTQDDTNGGEDYTSPTIGTLVYVPAGSFQRDATAIKLVKNNG
jgi:hypothetical protein